MRFRSFALLVLSSVATLAGCSDRVSGEVQLTPPLSTPAARATIQLWQYDPQVADASADQVGAAEVTTLAAGTDTFAFAIEPTGGDDDLAHYLTALVDLDGDGADEPGDYGVTDFFKVELGQDDAVVVLAPRSP